MRRSLQILAALALPVSAATAAQRETPAQGRPAFEAATIKPAAADAMRNQVMPTSPNRLYIPSMTLTWLVYQAYGDGGFNTSMSVRGGPDWANRTAFAVEGIASGPATPAQLRLMLQTLLEERFALKLRTEIQESTTNAVLALTVDRSDGTLGPKVKKWDGSCPPVMPALYFPAPRRPIQAGLPLEAYDPTVAYCPTGYRAAGGIRIDGATMVTVAEILSLPPSRALLGTITQDHTGLTDRYTMDLDFPFPAQGTSATKPPEFAGPSLPTAVLEQWGLRLTPSKGWLKVATIESAQLPASN